jgi:hypothetical protein
MSEGKNIFTRIGERLSQLTRGIGTFGKDVGDKTYEKAVDYTANAVIALVVLLASTFLFYGIYRWWDGVKDEQLNYVERSIQGVVRDAQTNDPVAAANVAIVGELEYVTRTDDNGLFLLSFSAHRDSTRITLSLYREGYEDTEKQRDIPLDEEAEKDVIKLTMQPKPPN